MTITLQLPPQIEDACVAAAQARGLTPDVVMCEVLIASRSRRVFERGLGLFGSPEDAALLDEVVAIAYEGPKRPAKPSAAF